MLEQIVAEYKKRFDDMAAAKTDQMDAPASIAQQTQAAIGSLHFQTAIGLTETDLPAGVQIVGGYLEDRTTIAFAGLLEREFGRFQPSPAFS